MLSDTDKHFANTDVVNCHINHRIAGREEVPFEIYKNIHTIDSDELKKYPSFNQRQVLGSIFGSQRKEIFVNKELLDTYFKDQYKRVFLSSLEKRKLKKNVW